MIRARTVCLALLLALGGCEGQHIQKREAGALGGGALGAGLGAIIGHQVGHAGAGVAIGGALGALSGALAGNEYDKSDADARARQEELEAQERQLAENRRLIDELRNKGADARITDRGVVVNLPDVLFEFDSSTLTSDAKRKAFEIAKVVKSTSNRRISVEGHTDSIGTVMYNKKLSENRARSVTDELVADGISRRRIVSAGFGETDPIASNSSAAGRSKNRRVEVIIEND